MQKSLSYLLTLLLLFYTASSHAERASLIIDANTNKVLHAYNVNLPSFPASLTKLMTIYLILEAIENNKLSFSHELTISAHAAAQTGSVIGLKEGKTISVIELALALIVKSANDAAVVAAEALSATEEDFVDAMNLRARMLGMKDTVFRNASGLPDPEQVTTARDMAALALSIYHRFPRHFHMFSANSFTYGKKTYKTHNHFMLKYSGAYGLKTGFTCNAGFNLVTLVNRKDQPMIGVILGETSKNKRDSLMEVLMDNNLNNNNEKKHLSLTGIRHYLSQGANGQLNKKAIARTCKRAKSAKTPALASSS